MTDPIRVVAALEEIADRLEIRGEAFFKVRAYRRAAQVVSALTEDLALLYQRGELDQLPGIGPALAQKIGDVLTTGTCPLLERLRREVPGGLLDLLALPGIGGKTVGHLWRSLGIENLDALEEAAQAGRLRELPGFGEKKERNVLAAIAGLRRRRERVPLGALRPVALALVEALAAHPAVGRVAMAGSLRRWRETAKDIDLVAAAEDPAPVLDAFSRLEQLDRVVARGETKVSAVLKTGVPLDLRVVRPGAYWTALHHFTGSAEHHVQLRGWASERGFRINEYELLGPDGKPRPVQAEEELYGLLGLAYVPPELREGGGEIEAAAEGSLPRLVSLEDIRGDLHAHTDWTDGAHSLEAMARAAKDRGYQYLAITDHARALAMAGGLDADRLRRQVEAIRRLNETLEGFRLLAGIEANVMADGSLDLEDEVLAELDVVVASVHSHFNQDEATMTRRVIRAMENPHVDLIAHPTGRLLGARDPYAIDVDAVIEAAARTGTALEINAHPDRLDLRDSHARRAREAGVKLAISTDAHHVQHLGLMEYGVGTARRGWVEPGDVLNAMPLDELLAHLGRN